MKPDFIEELTWRGMLHDIMPGTAELLKKESISGYIGFDPTADSLHIGSLAQIMTLLHFQKAGHRPIALVGGATGMVGDPSGKSAERNLLSEDILNHNLACQKRQLERFLDFKATTNPAEIVNNYDWFKGFSFLEFIRDVGKHITVNYMMAKDSVKNRLETGMSFTEFSYQLVQGYDFYYLWKHKHCKLQMGGSDQWGNIVTGTELIRRKEGGEAYALTTKLITKADGGKFGKTESGNVWLDAAKTSVKEFRQYWLNVSDEDAAKFIRVFTLFTKDEIEKLEKEHSAAPHLRILQKALATDVTIRVHSKEENDSAEQGEKIAFNKDSDLSNLTEEQIETGYGGVKVPLAAPLANLTITDFLTVATGNTIFPSKGQAREMITAGGVYINNNRIDSTSLVIDESHVLKGKYIIVRKGKKHYYLVVVPKKG